ncbi:hypothetical protein ACLOJK_007983 [Asimina triloba]
MNSFIPSVFPEVAELIQVWWFDIRGTIDMADLSPNTMYVVRFLVRRTPRHHGWGYSPIVLSLQLEDDPQTHERTVFMHPKQQGGALRPSKEYKDWMYVKVGEFFCDADGGEVAFRMQEVNEYKKGIIVMGVEIRPCNDQETEESSCQREDSNGQEDSGESG